MALAGDRMPDLQPGASEGGPVPQAGRAARQVPTSLAAGAEGEAVRGTATTPPDREARPNRPMISPRKETID